MMEVRQSPEELAEITVELLRRDGLREDVYVRPIIYKSSETIGVRLHNLDADITIFGVPFGQYIDTEGGIRAQVSSWRRTDDNAIPARGKITGAYVNGALAKSEAQLNGFDEAIVLTADGHVSEGSAENLFIVKGGVLITPPVTDNILEGITRARLIEIARDDLGIEVDRALDRPHRAVQRRRGLPVRHRRADQPGHRDRPPQRSAAAGPARSPASLSRTYFDAVRGPSARLPRLADPGLLGGGGATARHRAATGRAAGRRTMTTDQHDPDRLRWLGRLLEMVPGTISWAILILPLWLSFSYPWLVAYFVLSFDFYWLCRALWFSGAVIIAFRRIRDVLAVDWTERLAGLADPAARRAILQPASRSLGTDLPARRSGSSRSRRPGGWRAAAAAARAGRAATRSRRCAEPPPSADELIHLALIPTYTEPLEKLRHTVRALADAEWPTERKICAIITRETDEAGIANVDGPARGVRRRLRRVHPHPRSARAGDRGRQEQRHGLGRPLPVSAAGAGARHGSASDHGHRPRRRLPRASAVLRLPELGAPDRSEPRDAALPADPVLPQQHLAGADASSACSPPS